MPPVTRGSRKFSNLVLLFLNCRAGAGRRLPTNPGGSGMSASFFGRVAVPFFLHSPLFCRRFRAKAKPKASVGGSAIHVVAEKDDVTDSWGSVVKFGGERFSWWGALPMEVTLKHGAMAQDLLKEVEEQLLRKQCTPFVSVLFLLEQQHMVGRPAE